MFTNVNVELVRNGMTRGELAEKMGITATTMSFKLNGKSIITLDEAKLIKSILNSNLSLEELFEATSEAS